MGVPLWRPHKDASGWIRYRDGSAMPLINQKHCMKSTDRTSDGDVREGASLQRQGAVYIPRSDQWWDTEADHADESSEGETFNSFSRTFIGPRQWRFRPYRLGEFVVLMPENEAIESAEERIAREIRLFSSGQSDGETDP